MRTALALAVLLLVLVLVLVLAACGEAPPPPPAPSTPPAGPREPPSTTAVPEGPRPRVTAEIRDAPRPARPPASTRRLAAGDVEDFVAVMRELGTPEGKGDGLAAVLARRGIAPAWWSEMSSRITMAAIGVIPSRDAPVPDTWADDLALVRPHRERIRAAIAD